jgi:uncharacterized protein YjbJ (UPF0337 family)
MGMAAKIWSKAKELQGRASEAVGKVTNKDTNDESLEAEGKVDQVKGNVKQANEKAKDAIQD